MLKYPENFVNKVKKTIEFWLSETEKAKVLNALENHRGQLGVLLEDLSKIHHFSPKRIKNLFAVGAEQKILQIADFATACSELLREWDAIYREQKPNQDHFSIKQFN